MPILIPPLIQFGASLLDSAVNNYDETHQQNMQSLLTALQQRTNPFMAQGIIANPNSQMGGYPSPGYQNQEYQTGPEYPPSEEYPQQDYDPYQDPQQEQQDYPFQPMQPQYPQQGQPYPSTYGNGEMASDQSYQNPSEGGPNYQTGPIDMGQTTSIPISLDVLLVKKHIVNGVQSYLPIKDGETLFDGRGNPQIGDKFRVMFRANTDCYVYVIAVDGSAWAQGIFPSASSPFANPVKAGQQFVLPEGTNWFSLDQFKGIETVFFVASHEHRPDIENILAIITGHERHPAEKPMAVSEPAIIPNGYSGAHPGASPFAFKTSQSLHHELLPTTYFVKTAGEDLRITRWFRHQ